jgi:hypothetical protein
MSNPPPPPPLDAADLDASGDDESSSHSSSGSESDSNSGGGGGGGGASGGGDASADAAKLKLLLAASGSANTSSSSLVKSDSGSFVKSPTSSLPKGESSKAVASSAHPSRPPPVTPGRSSATAATGSLASDVVVDAVVSGFAAASPPTARPPAAPARRMSTDAPGSMSPRHFDSSEPVSANVVRPAVARRGSLETAVTASKPSQSPADVVDAVVSQSPPTSSSPPTTTADRTSRSSGSGGATAAAASAAAAKQKAPSAAAPAANAAAASGGANKEPGGMFSNMRKALARPSLGGLMRGKSKPKATPMFGVSIAEAAAAGGGMLPLPLLHSADVLVQRKLVDREGIFRLTGSIATINHIKELYNNDGAREAYQLLADEGNAHTIAGVLKLWLRELPERLIPNAILENVGSATRDIDRIALIVDVIKKLPPHNRVTLQKLCWVIHNAWQHRDANKMGVRNLSVVFAPNVLGLGRVSELMESLIRFYRFAFGIDPLPESDEALSAIMIEQFNDHTPTLSATNAAKAAAEAAATAPPDEGGGDDDDQQQPPPPEQEYGEEEEYAAEDGYGGGADEYAADPSEVVYEEGFESVDQAMARYNAMTDDELRAELTQAMTAQDFEKCLFLRDLLQARTTQV